MDIKKALQGAPRHHMQCRTECDFDAFISMMRWPHGPVCPQCGSRKERVAKALVWHGIYCPMCSYLFNWRVHTLFDKHNMRASLVVAGMQEFLKGRVCRGPVEIIAKKWPANRSTNDISVEDAFQIIFGSKEEEERPLWKINGERVRKIMSQREEADDLRRQMFRDNLNKTKLNKRAV